MAQPSIQQALELALQLQQAGRVQEAESACRQILARQASHAQTWGLLGSIAQQQKRHDIAIHAFRQAIALAPRWAEAHGNLGIVLREAGQFQAAIAACRQAVALNPQLPQSHNNLGNALRDNGQFREALAAYRQAFILLPNSPEIYCNIAIALYGLGQFDDALAEAQKAVQLDPNSAEAHSELGNSLKAKERIDEAIAAYRQAIALDPGFSEAWCNLGAALADNGQLDHAIAAYRKAIALSPTFAEAHWNLALCLLGTGDFQLGWEEYAWRFSGRNAAAPMRDFSQPQWDGGALRGRTLLVYAEQGAGDTLQFVRYLPLAAQRGGKIVFECQPTLVRLLSSLGDNVQIVPRGQALPAFDLRCPLLSLPGIFNTRLESIPARIPYLFPPPELIASWEQRLPEATANKLKVGLAWAGSPSHKSDRARSIALQRLALLANVRGITFYSLQRGDAASQAATPPAGMRLIDLMPQVNDYADTAALIAHLDLVISVDTSIAHLAGAMGKPVWTLLPFAPDWRWMTGRDDSPWYPTMRLFRQRSRGQWDDVVSRLARALALFAPNAEYNLAIALGNKGQVDDAIDAYRRAIAGRPNHVQAYCNLGNLLASKGDKSQAIGCYETAISIDPNFALAYSNLGNALREEGKLDEAITAHRRAVALAPRLAEAHGNLANALRDKGELTEAIAVYHHAIALKGDYAQAYGNLGIALADSGEFEQAIAAFDGAIALKANYAEAYYNLGVALAGIGKFDHAIAAYRQAISLLPDYADAHWNLALTLLTLGEFEAGWEEYEWRWKSKAFTSPWRNFTQPQWDGSPLNGRTLLLHAEQGFGDTLQFIRYVPMAASCGGEVVMGCPAELASLLQPLVGPRPTVFQLADLPAFEVHCPLLSLPKIFGTTLKTIPANVPYLRADAAKVEAWRPRVSSSSVVKVGLAWAGAKVHKNDRNRSLSLQALAPLASVKGTEFYSLQKGEAATETASPPPGMKLIDLMGEVTDFSDAAACIENLDLVITVDTAIAHLAGAMGKTVWTLLPVAADWRWLIHRADSPWYPTMRLFRQSRRAHWDDVIARVAEALTLFAAKASS